MTAVVLDGEAVVLAEGAGSAHYLDELATLVWNTFDGEATIDELAEDFADVFGAELDVVRDDIIVSHPEHRARRVARRGRVRTAIRAVVRLADRAWT